MTRSAVKLDDDILWLEDAPYAVWVRIVALNLDGGGDLDWCHDLRDFLITESTITGSNCTAWRVDARMRTASQAAAVLRTLDTVQALLADFGETMPSAALRALGFSGSDAWPVATRELLKPGAWLIERLVARRQGSGQGHGPR